MITKWLRRGALMPLGLVLVLAGPSFAQTKYGAATDETKDAIDAALKECKESPVTFYTYKRQWKVGKLEQEGLFLHFSKKDPEVALESGLRVNRTKLAIFANDEFKLFKFKRPKKKVACRFIVAFPVDSEEPKKAPKLPLNLRDWSQDNERDTYAYLIRLPAETSYASLRAKVEPGEAIGFPVDVLADQIVKAYRVTSKGKLKPVE
jgi:hypothetical protein